MMILRLFSLSLSPIYTLYNPFSFFCTKTRWRGNEIDKNRIKEEMEKLHLLPSRTAPKVEFKADCGKSTGVGKLAATVVKLMICIEYVRIVTKINRELRRKPTANVTLSAIFPATSTTNNK